jgi:hypothetical protein
MLNLNFFTLINLLINQITLQPNHIATKSHCNQITLQPNHITTMDSKNPIKLLSLCLLEHPDITVTNYNQYLTVTFNLIICYLLVVTKLDTGFQTTLTIDSMPGEIWYFGYGNFITKFQTVYDVMTEVFRLKKELNDFQTDTLSRRASYEAHKQTIADEHRIAKAARKAKYEDDTYAEQLKQKKRGFCKTQNCKNALAHSSLCATGLCRPCSRITKV